MFRVLAVQSRTSGLGSLVRSQLPAIVLIVLFAAWSDAGSVWSRRGTSPA